jgi:hypothetical protein
VLECGEEISRRALGSGRLFDETSDVFISEVVDIVQLDYVLSLASAMKQQPTIVWNHPYSMRLGVKDIRLVFICYPVLRRVNTLNRQSP